MYCKNRKIRSTYFNYDEIKKNIELPNFSKYSK